MDWFKGKEKEENVPDFYKLSLKKVIISGEVFGKLGEFCIEQHFINNRTKPLEVSYTFPITDTAAVTGFTVQVGDKVMKGVCKEKEEARKEYVENVSKGNSAYLLNQDSKNIFNVMVGRVLPNEEVMIKISYLDFFKVVDNKIRLQIPTLVFPRYNSKITDGLEYGKVDYTVDFNIKLNNVLNYESIQSVSHNIKYTKEKDATIISADNYDMSKDFVLDIFFKEEPTSNILYSKTKDGKYAAIISFMPEIEEDYSNKSKEYIFVVDISGSMSGEKIEQTKNALKRCLKELDEKDRFNIIPFESNYSYYQVESIEASENNIKEALKYVDGLRAYGGTEILKPLEFALYEKSDDKVVVLLTDGQVGNEDEIVSFVSKNIYNSKLFAFGIDFSVNSAFIKDVAKVGNGKEEFIYPGEDMEDAIVRTFARIQSPLVKDLKIEYGEDNLIDEIKQDTSLFNYEFFQVAALLNSIDNEFVLKGSIDGKEYSWKVDKEAIVEVNGHIDTAFAKLQIDRFEEYIRSYSRDFRNNNAMKMSEEYQKRIVDISTKYNIASKYTSFISVNEREEKVFDPTEFENVTLSDKMIEMAAAPRMAGMSFAKRSAPIKSKMAMRGSFINCDEMASFVTDEIIDDSMKNELEALSDTIDDLDIITLIMLWIYYEKNSCKYDLDKVKAYFEAHKDRILDKEVQELLLVFYRNCNNSTPKKVVLELLNPQLKKIATLNAEFKYSLKRAKFEKDNTKTLSNGKSIRKELSDSLEHLWYN